ncbi:unnamed protein product [marine sediment metagenome]|uniref:Uncharacterized protein n=1 Tax=marine sediment metagenome TaxID=412755 RepID=X1H0Z7_9ZZZZ
MLKRIEELLGALDVELQTLWCLYLQGIDQDALWDLKRAKARLAEAKRVYDEIDDLQTHIGAMQHRLKHAHALDPVRKEN